MTDAVQVASGEGARQYRAGDIVQHYPTGEDRILACDEVDGRVYWLDWPLGGYGMAFDCVLIEAATKRHRLDILDRIAAEKYDNAPGRHALRQLEEAIDG